MDSLRKISAQGMLYGVLAAVVSAGALLLYVTWFASTDRFAPGAYLGTLPVGVLGARADWQRANLGGVRRNHPLLERTLKERIEAIVDLDRHELARFRTRIIVADAGRVHNIRLAIEKINGMILGPGEIFSFNKVVGPRDPELGWAQAKELYHGEFVLGYGGGICQVSSTLYNAILLAGLQVKERYHHDRPLEYIEPGRDATVAWDLLDFRFANSLDTPVLVKAEVVHGSPQWIEVMIKAARQASVAKIRLEDADIKYYPPAMVEVFDGMLPSEQRMVEDEGYYGLEVKTYRVFDELGQERRELVSHDRYKPKPGKVRIGIGNRPGAERLRAPGLQ